MIRQSIVATALFSVLQCVACDKAADEQKKADSAQAETNERIAAAKKEAEVKITSAQVEADKKVAEARNDFVTMREDFRHKTQGDLDTLDHTIDDLHAKAKKATGKAKAELEANLQQIHAARKVLAADLKMLETASATSWDATKVRVEKELTELKKLVGKP